MGDTDKVVCVRKQELKAEQLAYYMSSHCPSVRTEYLTTVPTVPYNLRYCTQLSTLPEA